MGKLYHKYGATRCEQEGIKFPSKLEKDCYNVLKRLENQGLILFFMRQSGFDLPGGYRHYVDFCVFLPYDVIFLEAKGRDLEVGKLKRLQVEDIYNITIRVVKSAYELEKILFATKEEYDTLK